MYSNINNTVFKQLHLVGYIKEFICNDAWSHEYKIFKKYLNSISFLWIYSLC